VGNHGSDPDGIVPGRVRRASLVCRRELAHRRRISAPLAEALDLGPERWVRHGRDDRPARWTSRVRAV